jgi:hypothetical protein
MVLAGRFVRPHVLFTRARLFVLVAVLGIARPAPASTTDERAVCAGPSVLELSRQIGDRVRPAFQPSRWTHVVESFVHRTRQAGDDTGLVDPSMAALDTFFYEWEPVPRDKTLHVVVRDRQLVFDLVAAAEAPSLARRVHGLLVRAPTDASLLPPETEGLLELPSEVSEAALLVSHVAAVLEARALEFVLTFRSLLGLRSSPQALKPLRIERGGARVTLPTGSALVDAYQDPEEGEPDPKVTKRAVFRSGVKILLGFCLGLLFWGVIRNL